MHSYLLSFGQTRDRFSYLVQHAISSSNLYLMLVVGLVAYALAGVPQLVELYTVELSSTGKAVSWLGLLAALLFSLFLFIVSCNLFELLAVGRVRQRRPRWTSAVRGASSVFIAVLPLLGMIYGMLEARELIASRAGKFDDPKPPGVDLAGRWVIDPLVIATIAWMTLLAGWAYSYRNGAPAYWRPNWERCLYQYVRPSGLVLIFIAAALALVVGVEPIAHWIQWSSGYSTIEIAHWIGPLPAVFLALMVLFIVVIVILVLLPSLLAPEFVVLSVISAIALAAFVDPDDYWIWFGGVLLAGLALAVVAYGKTALLAAAGIAGLVSIAVLIASDEEKEKPKSSQLRDLETAFTDWIKGPKRNWSSRSKDDPYPIYIVAASGGGAYAATHIAHTLAALQDKNPTFARHIFAISGVSGGAVGAALFNGVESGLTTPLPPHTKDFGKGPRAKLLAEIIQGPHLSPLVAEIPAALFSNFFDRADREDDRAATLRKSYLHAIGNAGAQPKGFSAAMAREFLLRRVSDSFRADSGLPALVLNTTGVKNGWPIAAAPFSLAGLSHDQLKSLGDDSAASIAVLKAAIVSARFPGILPAYHDRHRANNFVDGGYADASGSATAMTIYKDLGQIIANPKDPDLKDLKDKVELRLVLLVATTIPKSEAAAGKPATRLVDTLAPLYAILRVRAQQARRAVARVKDQFKDAQQERKLILIELDDEQLELPLAWRLSKATYGVVAASIGKPGSHSAQDCEKAIHESWDITRITRDNPTIEQIRQTNSCGLDRILEGVR